MYFRYAYPANTLSEEITSAGRKYSRHRYVPDSDDERNDEEAGYSGQDQYPRRIVTRGFNRHRDVPEKFQTHDTALTFLKK